jgi:hypothetical protein
MRRTRKRRFETFFSRKESAGTTLSRPPALTSSQPVEAESTCRPVAGLTPGEHALADERAVTIIKAATLRAAARPAITSDWTPKRRNGSC